MPELPDVSVDFIANVGDFVSEIDAMIVALKDFQVEVHAAADAVADLHVELDALPDNKIIHVQVQYSNSGNQIPSEVVEHITTAGGGADSGALAAEAAATAASIGREAEAAQNASKEMESLGVEKTAVAEANAAVGGAADDSAHSLDNESGSAVRLYGWMRMLTAEISLFGGVMGDSHLIGSIPLWHLALDALVESFVGLLEASAALTVGLAAMAPTFDDIYNRLHAIAIVNNAANASIYPLTGSFKSLAQAAAPGTLELYGGALDLLTNKSGVLSQVVMEVVHGFDDWMAKLDVFEGSFTHTGALMTSGVEVLHQFAEILTNVGEAISNLVKADPGTVHYLLDIVEGFTKLIAIVSQLPTPILLAALAIHSFMVWGGLLATGVVKLLGPLASLATAMGRVEEADTAMSDISKDSSGFDKLKATLQDIGGGFASFGGNISKWVSGMKTAASEAEGPMASGLAALKSGFGGVAEGLVAVASSPWTWAIVAAAGIAALVIGIMNMKNATQEWANSMVQGASAARGLTQISTTYQNLVAVTDRLNQVNTTYAQTSKAMAGGAQAAATSMGNFRGEADGATNNIMKLQGQQKTLAAAQKTLSTDFQNEGTNVAFLAKTYGVNYTEAAELAGDANASLAQKMQGSSNAAKENYQLVENLVRGYGGLGAVTGTLGNDLNAVTFATELQNSKVGALNQSMDTFIQTVQAPTSSFLSLAQDMNQFASDAGNAGASMTGLGGSTVKTTRNVNSASIQLQQDFNNNVSAVNQMADAMRTQATITGDNGPLVSGLKASVAALIPLAGTNKDAAAQISALAQEAGGPATTNLQTLSKWAGNVSNPMQTLQKISDKAGISLSNLGTDASNLANTIQSSLNSSLVTQAEQLEGLNGKTSVYLQDLQKWGPADVRTQSALATLNNSQSEANYLATQGASGIQALTGKTNNYGAAVGGTKAERTAFNNDLSAVISKAPNAGSDVTKLANAIKGAGANSSATAGARAQLIKDLEHAGVEASTAKTLVNNLSGAIKNIPNKSVTISVTEEYSAVNVPGADNIQQKLIAGTGFSSGGRVPGFGGGDVHPAMLEGGEAIVPKHLVGAVAPFLKAGGVPGFAFGGLMGEGWATNYTQPMGGGGGHGGGGNSGPVHVHLNMDGREVAKTMLPGLVSETSKYGIRNSGKVTGLLKPS